MKILATLCKNPPSLKNSKEAFEVYNKDEVKVIISKLDGSNIEIPILLMLTMGLRAGEVCGLRWQDIATLKIIL